MNEKNNNIIPLLWFTKANNLCLELGNNKF